VNSALCDCVALTECLLQQFHPSCKQTSLAASLLAYSKLQVPEGRALHELTSGPNAKGFRKVRYAMGGVRDIIFQGRFGLGSKPLHILMSTSLEPFSSIRQRLDKYYDAPFPDQESFDDTIVAAACEKEAAEAIKR
jgi:hypothetical protein